MNERNQENTIGFGYRLNQLREERKLTLDELKDMLYTTKATLSRYENGLREPKYEFVERCAKFFNVSVDYMLGRTEITTTLDNTDVLSLLNNVLLLIENTENLTVKGNKISKEKKLLVESLIKNAIDVTKIKE